MDTGAKIRCKEIEFVDCGREPVCGIHGQQLENGICADCESDDED